MGPFGKGNWAMATARVFVGNLPDDVQELDLQKRFESYGKVTSISIKLLRRPPPFAFIEYEQDKSADDAVREMHGQNYKGSRLRVEISRGAPRGATAGAGSESATRQRGTQYRVVVSNLPTTVSWQDLKDFLRNGGDVVHSDVDRRGNGTASFATFDEMDRAIRKLDDSELKGERIHIREEQQTGSAERRRDRSPSPGRRRSRSRSRSRSHSRSRSPRRLSRYRSRSPSRSRSYSPRRNNRRRVRSRSRSR